jgi:hypothetical protein
VRFSSDSVVVTLEEDELTCKKLPNVRDGQAHELRMATLSAEYGIWFDGDLITAGEMEWPYIHNEGWVVFLLSEAYVRILEFEENFIVHKKEIPAWHRQSLLYEETFTSESIAKNWIVNANNLSAGIQRRRNDIVFRKMSNCFLRKKFKAPVAFDCTITPVPTDEFTAGITDAIILWMAGKPDGDLISYLDEQTSRQQSQLSVIVPLNLYWVDFGGNNNTTTRLRKNPYRHMIRQFTDKKRLLQRSRSFDITAAQNNGFVEFLVDGQPWIRSFDPHALEAGHIGFRAFCSDLELHSLKVWSISS